MWYLQKGHSPVSKQEAGAYIRVQAGKEIGLQGKHQGPGMRRLWAGKWVGLKAGIRREGIPDWTVQEQSIVKAGILLGVAGMRQVPVVEADTLPVGVDTLVVEEGTLAVGADTLVGTNNLVEAGIQGHGHYTH